MDESTPLRFASKHEYLSEEWLSDLRRFVRKFTWCHPSTEAWGGGGWWQEVPLYEFEFPEVDQNFSWATYLTNRSPIDQRIPTRTATDVYIYRRPYGFKDYKNRAISEFLRVAGVDIPTFDKAEVIYEYGLDEAAEWGIRHIFITVTYGWALAKPIFKVWVTNDLGYGGHDTGDPMIDGYVYGYGTWVSQQGQQREKVVADSVLSALFNLIAHRKDFSGHVRLLNINPPIDELHEWEYPPATKVDWFDWLIKWAINIKDIDVDWDKSFLERHSYAAVDLTEEAKCFLESVYAIAKQEFKEKRASKAYWGEQNGRN